MSFNESTPSVAGVAGMQAPMSEEPAGSTTIALTRARLGLSLREFGKAVGASAGEISKLERGVHYPKRGLAARIAALAGVEVSRLYA